MNKTYGLMFKDEMIRAYIKKQKTQTRRLKGQACIYASLGHHQWQIHALEEKSLGVRI